jgi:hypothetical protein
LNQKKNNITEVGEGQLVSDIETNYIDYHDSVLKYIKSQNPVIKVVYLQKKYETLYRQLILLSQINGRLLKKKLMTLKLRQNKLHCK